MQLKKNQIIFSLALGTIFCWVSLFISYQSLPVELLTEEDFYYKMGAIGGWPFIAFEYPASIMSANRPSLGDWTYFFLNLALWIAVSFLISFITRKHLENKKFMAILKITAIIISIWGLRYLLIKFD